VTLKASSVDEEILYWRRTIGPADASTGKHCRNILKRMDLCHSQGYIQSPDMRRTGEIRGQPQDLRSRIACICRIIASSAACSLKRRALARQATTLALVGPEHLIADRHVQDAMVAFLQRRANAELPPDRGRRPCARVPVSQRGSPAC